MPGPEYVLDVLVRLKDQISGTLGKVKNGLKGVGTETKHLETKTTALSSAMSTAAGILIRDVVRNLTASITETMKLGGQIEALSSSFNIMRQNAGATELSLKGLQKATKGTVADVDLLKAANQAMALGLPVDDLDELFAGAMKLGRAMGITTVSAVESLTTGIGRQSKLILDNLGITFKAEDAYKAYAEQLGISTSKLDENQKSLAWQSYAINEVMRKSEDLGDIQDQTISGQERWNASLRNFMTDLGGALGPLSQFSGAITTMLPLASSVGMVVIPQWIKSSGGLKSAIVGLIPSLGGAKTAFIALNMIIMANPIAAVIVAIVALIAGLVALYYHWKPFRVAVNSVWKALQDLWKSISKNPIIQALLIPLKALIFVFTHWDEVSKGIGETLGWLHKNILKPIDNFFRGLFLTGLNLVIGAVTKLQDAWKFLTNIGKGVTDGIKTLTKSLQNLCFRHATPHVEKFNKGLKESLSSSTKLTGKVKKLTKELGNLSEPKALENLPKGDYLLSKHSPAVIIPIPPTSGPAGTTWNPKLGFVSATPLGKSYPWTPGTSIEAGLAGMPPITVTVAPTINVNVAGGLDPSVIGPLSQEVKEATYAGVSEALRDGLRRKGVKIWRGY